MYAYEYKINEERLAVQCTMLISGGFEQLLKVHNNVPANVVRIITVCTLMGDFAYDPATCSPVNIEDYTTKLIKGGDEEFGKELEKFTVQLFSCSKIARLLFMKTIEGVM